LLLVACLAAVYHFGTRRLIAPAFERAALTPADHGLPYEDLFFTTADGLRLHAWLVPAPSPRGTVIFLHGHGGTPSPDLQHVPAFRDRGYSVLLLDFRAHGQSEGRFTSLGYFERRDLEAAIACLQERGIHRVGLLGFSMGAAVAMSAAGDLPAVAAVVADCGFAELWQAAAAGAREKGLSSPVAWIVGRLVVLLASLRLGAPLWAADPLRHVSRISPRPLLIVQAGCDKYIAVRDAQRLFAAARDPKELWVVPGAGHCAAAQAHPEAYYERVLGVFDRGLCAV
jgi:alpha-beta hydrolase superfamily lysophospholipase